MAETGEQPPQTNGISEDTEEDDKGKMRPADIDADMREMERRKRVEMMMGSRLFREELERIIESQMKEGGGPAGLLQQIQDMVGGAGRIHSGSMFKSSNCVVPINDIRGVESMGYVKGEKILRCKLASVFRLMDLYGWTHGINNHITARLNQEEEHFIINPFGMMFHEMTASSLVKVDMQGNIVEPGTTNFGVNQTKFQLHAAVHAARPDIKCIIHVHTPSVLAVSTLVNGLLPLCQEAAVIGEVSLHQYNGSASEPEEKDKIARSLGPNNKVMFLTNHGAVCCGETVEEAFFNVYNTVLACETQVKLLPIGLDNIVLLSDESRKQIYDAARKAPEGGATLPPKDKELAQALEKKEKRWRIGGMDFEALMRMLDNAGFRTGYIYRTPLIKGDPPRPRNDVEVPPAVSSLGYLLEEEEMYKQGMWKKAGFNKNDRTRWLNSPNVYQKVEILETGTTDPKKITKWVDSHADEWVADGSPTHTSTPVKIDAALQFVPKNTNPKEFKKLQQQIKENRRADKITSGPQSHILEGVSWEEAKKLQDANISMTGDQVILVGAASKGIIQRGFQHNATVYKTPYAKNPFDCVSDQELEEYKKVVTRRQKGEYYDEEQSESEALSSSAALPPSGVKSPLSETEEDSRTEPQVLRIETKTAPIPSQAEVVLSDVADQKQKRSTSLDRAKSSKKGVDCTDAAVMCRARLIDLADITSKKNIAEIKTTPLQFSHSNSVVSKGTQTAMRIYFYDSDEQKRDEIVPIAPPLPSDSRTSAQMPDILKNGHESGEPCRPLREKTAFEIETERRKSLMYELHKELSIKFESMNQTNRDECFEEVSITVFSPPHSTKTNCERTFEEKADFASDDTANSLELSFDSHVDDVIKDNDSLNSYVGDDFQTCEGLVDCTTSTSKYCDISPISFEMETCSNYKVVDTSDSCPEKCPSHSSSSEDLVGLSLDMNCNVTKRRPRCLQLDSLISTDEQDDETPSTVLLDSVGNQCSPQSPKQESDSLLVMSDLDFSPTDSSPQIVNSDSGYDADTDKTVYHNGTQLFDPFHLDSNSPSSSGGPIVEHNQKSHFFNRKTSINSLEEFLIIESCCEIVVNSSDVCQPTRASSPEHSSTDNTLHESVTSFIEEEKTLYTIFECSSELSPDV
ncbi:protein hu-li tai shao isoform X3 [Cimex lectularius]|uniref:Class II aldolase/adducin N-terminal domain-containing protein n=1 Tax=Cimex lectularius TaxID=79782 RepID=A0A8I6S385_CIMLE|nr:protein hu-li tai shao isoform X3 [Cimex lectularius]